MLSVEGTNLEQRAIVTTDVISTIDSLDICVPEERLLSCISQNTGMIDIYENKGVVTLKFQDKSKVTITSFPSYEYPVASPVEDGIEFTINSDELNRAIASIIGSISKNFNIKVEQTGVELKTISDKDFTLTCTDGYMLSRIGITVDKISNFDEPISYVIPGKFMSSIASIKKSELSVKLSRSAISITAPGIELMSLLIMEKYPNADSIIPKRFASFIEFDNKTVSNVIKRSRIFNEDVVKIDMSKENGNILIMAEGDEGSTYEDCKAVVSEDCDTIILDPIRLQMILGMAKPFGDMTIASINTPRSPIQFKGKDNSSWTSILMPKSL
jgi:DNA polymerase III sliding clamp (beta) subunit (PCNA family)